MAVVIRWLMSLALIGAAGWSGWWYLGAGAQEAGIEAWLDNQRGRGWVARTESIQVEGFPLDFRTTITDIHVTDTRQGWSWDAPVLKAASRSYEPTRIVVTWPDRQTFASRDDRADVRAALAETVLDLRPGPGMELRQAATRVETLRIQAERGGKSGAEKLSVDLVERDADRSPPNSYELTATALDVRLPEFVIRQIDPTGWLKPKIDRLTIRAHGAFAQALGRRTVETGTVDLTAATIAEASFEWGPMRLALSGQFTVDPQGYPVGEIAVEAREWRQMVRLAVSAGVLDDQTAQSVIKAIEVVNALAGGREELRAPFRLAGGKIRLGPFAIADAPRLAER